MRDPPPATVPQPSRHAKPDHPDGAVWTPDQSDLDDPAMFNWFGQLQQKALADPFAPRYAQAAQIVLLLLAGFVFMVTAAFLIAYNGPPPEPSPEPTRSSDLYLAKIALGLMVLGALSLLEQLFRLIKTASPQPNWRSFPSLWSPRRKQCMALLSGASTFLGLGIATTLLILIVWAISPQWLVGAVLLVLVSITIWGSLVVGLRYYQDLCSGGQTELAPALKTQADQLQEALQATLAQFESVRAELGQHHKTLATLQAEVSRNQQAVAISRERTKAQETLERYGGRRFRREQLFFVLIGALLAVILDVIVDFQGLRQHLPPWLTLFD